MNRNTEQHFTEMPRMHFNRSTFDESHSHKTTINNGDIVPIYLDMDILPGTTVTMDMAEVVRMATPIYPVMDNLILDIYWFFVPHRLVDENWAEFWGENDDPWVQQTEYEIPKIKAPEGGWAEYTIADYMGVPTYVDGLGIDPETGDEIGINALGFRAYAKVFNDWFRDENLKSNCNIYKDHTTRTGTNTGDYVINTELGAKPCKAAKTHDYFTSCLPAPQKGPEVSLPLTGVLGVSTANPGTDYSLNYNKKKEPIAFRRSDNNKFALENSNERWNYILYNNEDGPHIPPNPGEYVSRGGYEVNSMYRVDSNVGAVYPTNLYADLADATMITINQLRTAFAIQKYYEAAGRNGTRYIEYLRAVFGVESSDARIQRSEYLGGKRIPINIDQVLQTSSTDNTSPQGNTAGFSCTIDHDDMFTKSFEEHGTLLCMAVVRVAQHTYQQGLHKQWTRTKWTDFYNPYFANLGEQAVLNENIYAQGTIKDKEAFGYQEAWAEYRYKENRVSGAMRSNAPDGSLDAWHYADDYNSLPTLSGSWIDEPVANVDRTIAVSSELTHQFICDFYFKTTYTMPMPVYSIPGLIDHV